MSHAVLVLENGRVFRGHCPHPMEEGIAEVVFNTSLSGYQEILTDPSYAGQIVVMTAPQIGNTGVNADDMESHVTRCAGLVMRELSPNASNWRSEASLPAFLAEQKIPAIDRIDTRALTHVLRREGAMRGAISTSVDDIDGILRRIKATQGMEGQNLVSEVSCAEEYLSDEIPWNAPGQANSGANVAIEFEIVAYDFGIKKNILRDLRSIGCRVLVVPAGTSATDVLAKKPDGIFLSNGPGDPAALGNLVETAGELAASGTTLFGICLGHQLLSLGLGAKTYKLPFGHHGGNHPVMDLRTKKVEITAHNHGFSVDAESLPNTVQCTHLNLNDKTVEGIELTNKPVFSAQYHPEGGPGPRDAAPLFQRFADIMRKVRS